MIDVLLQGAMTVNSPEPTSPINTTATPSAANRLRNGLVALVAIALSVALFFGLRTESGAATLASMAETAMPLDMAFANHKPTLVEFYADWCTTCQSMAPDLKALKEDYGDRVNFVMLNVDNTKWLPEVLTYRVDGIPHFVFMDAEGGAIASAIGLQPRPILAANLEALATAQPLPYLANWGRVSEFQAQAKPTPSADDPRSHGSQVVTPQT